MQWIALWPGFENAYAGRLATTLRDGKAL